MYREKGADWWQFIPLPKMPSSVPLCVATPTVPSWRVAVVHTVPAIARSITHICRCPAHTHTRRPPSSTRRRRRRRPRSGGDGRRFEAPPPCAPAAAPAGVAAPESIRTCAVIAWEEKRPSAQGEKVWGRIRRPLTGQVGRPL